MNVDGVFVGELGVLGYRRDRPVLSAITKARVAAPELHLTELNLDGDRQADLTVHGGVDKAVYVYPAEHYPAWAAEGFEAEPGGFGENVSLTGVTEDDVRIGDVWAWGDALVQVSQPRQPCFKLAMKTGRKDVTPLMIDSGRCGWYLRVLRPGTVPTSGPIEPVERADGPTITEVYLVSFANYGQLPEDKAEAALDLADRVLATPALSVSYRDGVQSTVDRWRARRAG
ncbi:MOSC domain-containing protein [Amycolatopsis mediterranei S699]|uniref:MOSC domain-containing protein n=2 Tax=Amycolatopsis mediterranei TaxID=33910 RepID=A0A0H3DGE2_AMYMU|nr:MOSC domain-containing protein [Amycolatopsis mediterranei]ADJ49965.1 MOSC domain-containing protein [Amycolatopsis mediterranei U32]AEK46958.1 6-N-hydroxylaminopurine resistance protein [Amycolatopsis mediterranei S699]AFO81673.1 MOSC domain-containing protein [Amycolatopsis mediterranei S699]AGT88802.1 MOSC domain-containing protein [Amycolatopsis mediterranei RB]KDO07787.1 sulfurase [Amycolatopsis mediterranei]